MAPPAYLRSIAAFAAAHSMPYKPPRISKQRLTFFERGWTDFPLGWLPLDLLTRLSACLVAIVASEREFLLPPRRITDPSIFGSKATSLYDPETLQTASRSDLEHFLRSEEDDLLCIIFTAPARKANPYLHRELLRFAIRRLGQIYGECKKRWTAKEARAMMLAQAERLWADWLYCRQLLLLLAAPRVAQREAGD
jgi:hypothetical protein